MLGKPRLVCCDTVSTMRRGSRVLENGVVQAHCYYRCTHIEVEKCFAQLEEYWALAVRLRVCVLDVSLID